MSLSGEKRSSSSVAALTTTPSQEIKKLKSSRSSVSLAGNFAELDALSVKSDSRNRKKEIAGKTRKLCECGPDLYGKILGPTADEAILTGFKTIIDLCHKLNVCEGKNHEGVLADKEFLQEVPERDIPSQTDSTNLKTANSQTDGKHLKTSTSQASHEMVSAGFQVNPSVKHNFTQTAPIAEMVSEILQTIGLTPELMNQLIQTSTIEIPQVKKASLYSIFMQTSNPSLRSGTIQTVEPDVHSGIIQTSLSLLPTIFELPVIPEVPSMSMIANNVETDGKETAISRSINSLKTVKTLPRRSVESDIIDSIPAAIKMYGTEATVVSKGDEHKAISPPEPPESVKTCPCCKCSSSSGESVSKKECICHAKGKSKCRCGPAGSLSSSTSVHGDPKQSCLEVRYSVTKISKYKEFTTFEIMRSTRSTPRNIPKSMEGVFVLKHQNSEKKGKNAEPKVAKEITPS